MNLTRIEAGRIHFKSELLICIALPPALASVVVAAFALPLASALALLVVAAFANSNVQKSYCSASGVSIGVGGGGSICKFECTEELLLYPWHQHWRRWWWQHLQIGMCRRAIAVPLVSALGFVVVAAFANSNVQNSCCYTPGVSVGVCSGGSICKFECIEQLLLYPWRQRWRWWWWQRLQIGMYRIIALPLVSALALFVVGVLANCLSLYFKILI